MKRSRAFKPAAKAVQKVQKLGGDGADFAGAVIPQDMIDFRDGAFIVAAGFAVTGIQTLPGVGVEEL
jgi:hypothetical protein